MSLLLRHLPVVQLLVTGGTDKRCRIFSAFVKEIDSAEDEAVFAGIFPNQYEFGEVLYECDFNAAWVNSVAWSPGYFRIAFAGTASALSLPPVPPTRLLLSCLPLIPCLPAPACG